MQYFDSSYQWTCGFPANYIFSKEISLPVHRVGLLLVSGIATAHIIMMGVTVTTFLCRTRATLLGNVWQTVAQVVSDRTTKILWKADSMKDKEVKAALSGTAYESEAALAGVVQRRQNGRNEFGSLTD